MWWSQHASQGKLSNTQAQEKTVQDIKVGRIIVPSWQWRIFWILWIISIHVIWSNMSGCKIKLFKSCWISPCVLVPDLDLLLPSCVCVISFYSCHGSSACDVYGNWSVILCSMPVLSNNDPYNMLKIYPELISQPLLSDIKFLIVNKAPTRLINRLWLWMQSREAGMAAS